MLSSGGQLISAICKKGNLENTMITTGMELQNIEYAEDLYNN